MRLPLPVAAHASPAIQPAASKGVPLVGQRILVVDDNRDAADSLGLLLKADGAQVMVVYDGQAALAAMESFAPHVVLLDLGMPEIDGFEVARRVRRDARFSQIRLAALTGWGQDADRQLTRQCGFDFHITKPVDIGLLEQWLSVG